MRRERFPFRIERAPPMRSPLGPVRPQLLPLTQLRGTLLPGHPGLWRGLGAIPRRIFSLLKPANVQEAGEEEQSQREENLRRLLREEVARAASSVPPEEEIPFGDLEAKESPAHK